MPGYKFEVVKDVKRQRGKSREKVTGSRTHRTISESVWVFDAQHEIVGETSDEDDLVDEKGTDESIVHHDAIISVLVDLMFSIQKKAIGKLIDAKWGDSLDLISTGKKLSGLYHSLSEIYQNDKRDFSEQLAAMIKVIEDYNDILPDNIVALKSWLALASDALLLKDINLGRAMSENLQDVLGRTRTLLENGTLQSFLPEKYVEQFIYLLEQCSLATGLFARFRNLPQEPDFSDYLQLLRSDPLLRNVAPENLFELLDFADRIKTKLAELDKDVLKTLPVFPDQGGYDKKLEWLVEVLSAQGVQRVLAPYFDPRLMALFRTPAALMHLFRTYPVEAGVLGKLHWVATQTAASNETHPFKGTLLEPILLNLQQSLAGGKETMLAIEMIMKLTDPEASAFERIRTAFQPLITSENFFAVASFITPWSAAARTGFDLFSWYQKLPPESTWEQTLAALVEKIRELAAANSDPILSGVGLSGTAAADLKCVFDGLTGIRREWTWNQTVSWLLLKAKESPSGRWYYDRLLEFCLAWQLYQAARGRDADKVAQALSQARDVFGNYLPGISGAAVDKIVSLLPLLPGLIALRREVARLPETTSWITWLNGVVAAAGKSEDPSVRRLIEQVDAFVENVCTEAVLTVLNSLSGAAATLMQDPPTTGSGDRAASGEMSDFPARPNHEALVRALCEAGGQVGSTLLSLSGAVLQGMAEYAVSRPAVRRRRYALLDPTALTDLLLPPLTLALGEDLASEFLMANTAERTPTPNDSQIIWGDEHAKRKKVWASAVLAAYWAATSWALYKQVSKRCRQSANEPLYSALAPESVPTSTDERIDSGDLEAGDASVRDAIEAAQKLTIAPNVLKAPPTPTRIAQFIRKYQGEMAVGGAVLLGAGLTFYITKNVLLTGGPDLDLSEIVEKSEFVDVTESADFSGLFDDSTQFFARKNLSVSLPENAEENLKRYVSDLSAGLAKNTLLRQFFDDLMGRLVPKMAKNKGLMFRMNDDFAFFLELDQMICNMQNYIVVHEIDLKNYTHLKALLLLNRIRNYILNILIEKYQEKAVSYYSVSSGKTNFTRLEEFWNTELVRVYVQSMLHESGASLSEIEEYGGLLRIIMETARLSATEYTEGGGVGFVDEGGVIKLAVDGVRERLSYVQGKLSWEKKSRGDASAAREVPKDIESVERYSRLVGYLQQASKDLASKEGHDFSYPGDVESSIKSRFIKERCAEIMGAMARKKIIIPVTYENGSDLNVAMFSLEQIALGVHLKHYYYKNRAAMNWPEFILDSQKTALLGIRQEAAWIDRILSNIDLVKKHVAVLKNLKLEGIVAYTESEIKKKAQELGIAQEVDFRTKISVTATETVPARPGGRRPQTKTYALGQVAFSKLASRQDMHVSPPQFAELVKFLDETDFQTPYQERVLAAKQDAEIKSAFDTLMLAKVQPYLDDGLRLKQMKFSGYELAGLFAFEDTDGKFKIVSLVDNSLEYFDSMGSVSTKLRRNRHLRQWILKHSIDPSANWVYENGGYRNGAILPISFDDEDHVSNIITYHGVDRSDISFFLKFAERLYNEADTLAKSKSEIAWARILSWLDVLGFFIQLATAPLGLLPAIAISAAAEGISSIGKAIIADDPDEKNGHLLQAALCVGLEAAGEGAPKLLGKFFEKISSSPAYRRFTANKVNRKFGKWLDEVDLEKQVRQGESPHSLELIRDIDNEVMVKKSADVMAKIRALEQVMQKDPDMNGYLSNPAGGNSFDAARQLNSLLQPNGNPPSIPGKGSADLPPALSKVCRDKNITLQYRAINAWSRLAPDSRVTHLAVVCEIDEVKYVVDPTSFEAGGRHVAKDVVLLEQEWVKKNQEGLTAVLVKYKDFSTFDGGKQFCRTDYSFDVDKTEPGTVVLSSPDWYEPDLLNYAGLNQKWRADVDLDKMTRDADGIYVAGTEPDASRYIKDSDGSIFWVKKDVDMNTWRVINPANPGGYAPPVRREMSGRWVRHLDLAGKGGAPVLIRQTHLEGANLKAAQDFMKEGKRQAQEQLDDVARSFETSADRAMIEKLAEAFWGPKWLNDNLRRGLVEQLKAHILTIKKRAEIFDPVNHVDYFNVKIKHKDGIAREDEGTVAETDSLNYSHFVQDLEDPPDTAPPVKYMNVYEKPLAFIKSRDDLGSQYMGRVIAHELTHGDDTHHGLLTKDWAYIDVRRFDKRHDLTNLANLAFNSNELAATTADSYATFIHYLWYFKKNPKKYVDFKAAFDSWKVSRTQSGDIKFLFEFNVERRPLPFVTMRRAVRDSFRNMSWRRASDQQKIENLIRYATQLPEARRLSYFVGQSTLELSIRNSLQLDYEGVRKTRFSWGTTPEVDLEKIRVRMIRDTQRYMEAETHLNSLSESPPALVRRPLEGESPETAAARWILKSSRSGSNEIEEIKRVIAEFKDDDLFDPATIGKVHDRVYRPPPGGAYRSARTADNSLFMSLDVANYLLIKQVGKTVSKAERAGDHLFAILVRTHPYGDGNGRTARTLYAIQRLRLNEPSFRALTKADEDLLSGLPPEGGAANPVPEPVAGPSHAVQELVVGSQLDANRREYRILESGEDFHLGHAALDDHTAHITSWRKGEQPLQNQAQDLVIYAGALRTRPRGVPGSATAPSVTNESEKKLIFYAPGTYRISDPDVVAAANKSASNSPRGGAAYLGGFKPNEFEPMGFPEGFHSGRVEVPEPSFVYSSETQPDAVSAAVISGISEYRFSHYIRDYLETGKMALLAGSTVSGDRRADILSLTAQSTEPMTVEEVLREVSKTRTKYKRIHLGACRELGDSAKLHSAAAAHTEGRRISHLATLITLDTENGTIEETVQGAIARDTGEYLEMDTSAGDTLSIPGYEQLNWGTPEYGVRISDAVIDQSVTEEHSTARPKVAINDSQNIYIRDGVFLMYRNGKFTHFMAQHIDIHTLCNIVYGSSVQDVNVARRNINSPKNKGKISVSQVDNHVSVQPGAQLDLGNLYRVGHGETLKSIALSKLGWTSYARQLAWVNVDLLAAFGVAQNPVDSASLSNGFEKLVDCDKEIPPGSVVRIPTKISTRADLYKQRGDGAYNYLMKQAYGYESEFLKAKLKTWNDLKLLSPGQRIEETQPQNDGSYLYIAPL